MLPEGHSKAMVMVNNAVTGSIPGANVPCIEKSVNLGRYRKIKHIPSSDDVMIQSFWNPSQQIGSSPTILDLTRG
jgi:hypothetical protein